MTVGNIIGGKLADWKLMPTVIGTLAALVLVHSLFAEVSGSAVATIAVVFVWGVLTFVIVPPLQMRVVETADEAPNLAATLNQGAFNVGNACGAWIGGAALTWGVSYQNLPFVGAALALVGLLIAFWSLMLDRKAYHAGATSPRRDSGSASSHWRGSDGLVFNAPGEASAFLREPIILLGQDGQTFCSKSFIGPNVAARKSTGRSSGSPSHINIILKSNSGLFYREIQEKMRNLAIFTRASLLFTRHHRGFYSDCCTCAHGANALTLAPSDQLPGWCDLSRIGGSHVHNMAFLSA